MRFPLHCLWAASAVVLMACASGAAAQSPVGKTIRAHFTFQSCGTINGVCGQPLPGGGNFYISSEKNVFDYGASAQGTMYRLGVPQHAFNATITFAMHGNTISVTADSGHGGSTTTDYRIQGDSCVISSRTTYKNVTNRVEAPSCTVTEGNANK